MKLIIWVRPTSVAPSPHTILRYSSSSWGVRNIHNTNNNRSRDRVIDFGKHKGKMLGTLSSEYLRWMSKNLNTDNFKKWGKLAEDVLEDEVYADRMEWEVAEKLLSGDTNSSSGVGVARELEEMSNRFGWDYNDKVGWSKVDFGLLGTSMGGRLPRARRRVQDQHYKELENKITVCGMGTGTGTSVERGRRRDRAAKKREQQQIIAVEEEMNDNNNNHNNNNNDKRNKEADEMDRSRQFPGRQSLINKLLLHGRYGRVD